MTKEEILAMNPGRELDVLVAEKVMGWKKNVRFVNDLGTELQMVEWKDEKGYDITRKAAFFYPSTDISAAWEVVEKFENYKMQKLRNNDHRLVDGKDHQCFLGKNGNCAYGRTIPEAICKAALLAVMEI